LKALILLAKGAKVATFGNRLAFAMLLTPIEILYLGPWRTNNRSLLKKENRENLTRVQNFKHSLAR
jgi:hypothetical protein